MTNTKLRGAPPRALSAAALALGLLAIVGCGGVPAQKDQSPVDREQWEARSNMLLHPLCTDSQVGCTELLVEMSPNYFKNFAQPALNPKLHVEQKSSKDGIDEFVWTNKLGSVEGAIEIMIGATDEITEKGLVRGKGTKFLVVHQATLRVHTKGRMAARLDVTAKGKPIVLRAEGIDRDLAAFELRNGALHAQ